jgi:hypothetical protein
LDSEIDPKKAKIKKAGKIHVGTFRILVGLEIENAGTENDFSISHSFIKYCENLNSLPKSDQIMKPRSNGPKK